MRVLRITQVCVRIVPITSMEDEHDSVRKIDGSELYVIVGEIRQSESQYRNEFWIDQWSIWKCTTQKSSETRGNTPKDPE